MNTIEPGRVATIHYTLRNDDGDILDSSDGGEPISYLQGYGNVVPGLDKALEGKSVGDKLDVVVEPAEGYGEADEDSQRALPRSAFPEDIEAGMQLLAEGDDGQVTPIWVLGIEDETVFIDLSHPLAGERLHFAIEIVEVRAASSEELSHGHPHGRYGDQGH